MREAPLTPSVEQPTSIPRRMLLAAPWLKWKEPVEYNPASFEEALDNLRKEEENKKNKGFK